MAENVISSASAREDLRAITEYIASDRPGTAEAYCLELIAFAETAGEFPRAGRKVPEADDANVREIRPPYRVIYDIFPGQPRPVIMRVWHAARGAPEIRPSSP